MNDNTITNDGSDMTAKTYRLSLGLPVDALATRLDMTASQILGWEREGGTAPDDAMARLGEQRAGLIDEIRSFMADEQEMRRNGESDPETGGWDFTLYRDSAGFAAADQPTHITDWRIWNQAYLIIGLLMEALGYDITYRRTED
ncbi:hypothetical protein PT282_03920 [Bifidobacterium sp. ESL0763]|uniref:hypothetical protein n=1 Tax=Bifidobacterium sp. ESL0763 TaxID=2983227 RepID=UPI0023F6A3EB|nr:hypothetical protein [Bifidobacterium sp. ESL0763]MDF7663814.1 hypothetical protein [Bifidobacterium sp. ESL0763]